MVGPVAMAAVAAAVAAADTVQARWVLDPGTRFLSRLLAEAGLP